MANAGLDAGAAEQLWAYYQAGRIALGALPSQRLVIAERFFDDSGGMQLIIHAPFGVRINRAWGLALRKRLCGGFGFELEAAANENAILFSLGPATSFPLAEVFTFLAPATVRNLLIQACITGGQFETRWRWNVSHALVVARWAGGKKVPAYLTRIRANDALMAAFPGVLACPETRPPGPLSLPAGHPLVDQTLHDCLTELMDVDGLIEVLEGIRCGRIGTRAVEVAEPSPFAGGILAAKPYAFLDEVPFEERRVRAVAARRSAAAALPEIGELDPALVEELKREVWPQPRDAEEVHEALGWMGYVEEKEARPWLAWLAALQAQGRVVQKDGRWSALDASSDPKEVLRGRLEALGPLHSDDPLLLELEHEGSVLRTRWLGRPAWCHRRLLARLHRAMLGQRRARVEPASAQSLLRMLARWQCVEAGSRRAGPRGLAATLDQLAGFEAPAPAWSARLLSERVQGFRPEWLDALCLSGEFAWGRLWTSPTREAATATVRPTSLHATPICLVRREQLPRWLALAGARDEGTLSANARSLLAALRQGGAQFQHELARSSGLLAAYVEEGQCELIANGLITCDSFNALRWLLLSAQRRARARPPGGRWSLLRSVAAPGAPGAQPAAQLSAEDDAMFVARQLLTRTGVVFRETIARERQTLPWRDLLRALRTLELRGEVLGGRFVAGFSGEQFALPDAATALRALHLTPPGDAPPSEVSPADPLNFLGILTPDERVRVRLAGRVRVG
jgi:ATP-dependent Lhr-like helicase